MKTTLLFCFFLVLLPGLVLGQRLRETEWEKGLLDKGEKIGVWEYYGYTRDGKQLLLQKYDYTNQKLVEFRPLDDIPYRAELTPGQWTLTTLDQQPMFIGSDPRLSTFASKLNYPAAAQERHLQGRVVVSFVIDTLGQASDHQVLVGIGGGCDEEALRVCRAIPNEWIPARKGNRAVPVIYQMPFTYKMR